MVFFIGFDKYFTYLFLFTLAVNKSWSKHQDDRSTIGLCGHNRLIKPKGSISSPFYPVLYLYPYEMYCTWNILSPPQSILKIHVKDFDIPEDSECNQPPCCRYNYLSLPVNGTTNDYVHVCGNITQPVITVSQIHTTISFRYSLPSHHGRGFQLTYSIEKNVCEDKFRCNDGTCLSLLKRCDGIPQCSDGEDEMLCSGSDKCADGDIFCGPLSDRCFKITDKCDGVFQCPYGEDESGCSSECELNSIKCQTGEECYLPGQRCDGHSDCLDESDESMCADELCPSLPSKRQCHNGRCIQAKLWCDGNDDCGDFSDEEACLKISMITIAMMGALLGGLFLVLAVGCSLRIYSRRYSSSNSCQLRVSPPGMSRIRMPHSLSLPALIDNEFFHREPPPMYSVAVGNAGLPRRSRGNRSRSSSRRSNHTNRHTVAVPVPKPPSSENTLNDSSSSPSSEESLLCSSNTHITNTDDSELLISA